MDRRDGGAHGKHGAGVTPTIGSTRTDTMGNCAVDDISTAVASSFTIIYAGFEPLGYRQPWFNPRTTIGTLRHHLPVMAEVCEHTQCLACSIRSSRIPLGARRTAS